MYSFQCHRHPSRYVVMKLYIFMFHMAHNYFCVKTDTNTHSTTHMRVNVRKKSVYLLVVIYISVPYVVNKILLNLLSSQGKYPITTYESLSMFKVPVYSPEFYKGSVGLFSYELSRSNLISSLLI